MNVVAFNCFIINQRGKHFLNTKSYCTLRCLDAQNLAAVYNHPYAADMFPERTGVTLHFNTPGSKRRAMEWSAAEGLRIPELPLCCRNRFLYGKRKLCIFIFTEDGLATFF